MAVNATHQTHTCYPTFPRCSKLDTASILSVWVLGSMFTRSPALPSLTILRINTSGLWWLMHTNGVKRTHQFCLSPSALWSVWHCNCVAEAWWSAALWNHNLFLGSKKLKGYQFRSSLMPGHVQVTSAAMTEFSWLWWCADKCLTVGSLGKKPWLIANANLGGVNTPTVADSKLPTWCHWIGKKCTRSSPEMAALAWGDVRGIRTMWSTSVHSFCVIYVRQVKAPTVIGKIFFPFELSIHFPFLGGGWAGGKRTFLLWVGGKSRWLV